ncbi:MAG: hypothetical protein GX200_09950 [Firmicutes bacterium]|nr:hypothetical protein [Bacillota bacterium]
MAEAAGGAFTRAVSDPAELKAVLPESLAAVKGRALRDAAPVFRQE